MEQETSLRREGALVEADQKLLAALRENRGRKLITVCGKEEHFLCEDCSGKKGNKCFVCSERGDALARFFYVFRDDQQEKQMKKTISYILQQAIQTKYRDILTSRGKVWQDLQNLVKQEESGSRHYKLGAYSINLSNHNLKSKQAISKMTQTIVNRSYQNDYLEDIVFPLFLAIDVISSLILMVTIFLQIYFMYLHSRNVVRPGAQTTFISLYGVLLWAAICLMNLMDGFWMGQRSCNRVCRFYETLCNRLLFISVVPVNIAAIFFTLPLITIEQHMKVKHTISWLFPFSENPRIVGYSLLIIPNSVYLIYIYSIGVVTMGWQEDQSYILMPVIFFSLVLVPLVIFMDYRVHQAAVAFEEKEREQKEDYIIRNDQMFLRVFRREINRSPPKQSELKNINGPSNNSFQRISLDPIRQ